MQGYIPIEYPKWIDGVVVQNAAEEQEHRAALAETADARNAGLIRPPPPASIRMRRSRERRREGKLSIRCDVSSVQIEALTKTGFIDSTNWNDVGEVAWGVGRLMDHLARSEPSRGSSRTPRSS